MIIITTGPDPAGPYASALSSVLSGSFCLAASLFERGTRLRTAMWQPAIPCAGTSPLYRRLGEIKSAPESRSVPAIERMPDPTCATSYYRDAQRRGLFLYPLRASCLLFGWTMLALSLVPSVTEPYLQNKKDGGCATRRMKRMCSSEYVLSVVHDLLSHCRDV